MGRKLSEKAFNPRKIVTYKGTCPSCKETLVVTEQVVEEHGYVDCPNCQEILEIRSVEPLKLSPVEFDDEFDDLDEGF